MSAPNVERLRKLADHMEGLPSHTVRAGQTAHRAAVYMGVWVLGGPELYEEHPECGTVGCIAAHCVDLFDGRDELLRLHKGASFPRVMVGGRVESIGNRADELLGLNTDEEHRTVFYPPGLEQRDGADCAAVLRHIADNPETDTEGINAVWALRSLGSVS